MATRKLKDRRQYGNIDINLFVDTSGRLTPLAQTTTTIINTLKVVSLSILVYVARTQPKGWLVATCVFGIYLSAPQIKPHVNGLF